MKFLIATADYPPDGGGIGAYACGLRQGLETAGCEATVLARNTPARCQSRQKDFSGVTVDVSGQRLGGLYTWYQSIRDQTRQQHYDWVIIPTWDPVAIAATLPLFRRAIRGRIAVVFHGADVAAARGRKARLLAHVMRSADRILANSTYTRELIEQRYELQAGIVRPAIGDADLKLPCVSRRSSTAVITVGRLVPRKGHALVMAAIARLAREFPAVSYTIVGDGPERQRLEKLAASLSIRERVCFRGQASPEEKRRQLAEAAVFAMPVVPDRADPEGYGIAYLEAGAARLPVLATATGGVAECVQDGYSGLFCEATIEDVVAGLRRLFTEENLGTRLGEGGRRVAEASVWTTRASELLNILENCA